MVKITQVNVIQFSLIAFIGIILFLSHLNFWQLSSFKPVKQCKSPTLAKTKKEISLLCFERETINHKETEEILPLLFREKLDINTAKKDWLELLPSIGPKMAERIIESRNEEKFTQIEEIVRVKGIGQKTFEKIQPFIKVTAHP